MGRNILVVKPQWKALIGPLKGMSHGAVVVGNERQDLLLEIPQRREVSSLEQFARQDAEPDLDLIHKGGHAWGYNTRRSDGWDHAERLVPSASCGMPSLWAIQRTSDSD